MPTIPENAESDTLRIYDRTVSGSDKSYPLNVMSSMFNLSVMGVEFPVSLNGSVSSILFMTNYAFVMGTDLGNLVRYRIDYPAHFSIVMDYDHDFPTPTTGETFTWENKGSLFMVLYAFAKAGRIVSRDQIPLVIINEDTANFTFTMLIISDDLFGTITVSVSSGDLVFTYSSND